MGFINYIKQVRAQRKVIAESKSPDWNVAENAIRRIPEVLDPEAALAILLPLSRGQGSRLANPLTELPPTPTYEMLSQVHLSSAIAALGRMKDARASARLAEIITQLPNFAARAFDALGSPCHAAFASQLAGLAARWPRELRSKASSALWHMGTEEAMEAYVKIQLEDGSPFSEETLRKACATRLEEIRNPQRSKGDSRKPVPLPD